jgi:WD domain, G-beta repeat.
LTQKKEIFKLEGHKDYVRTLEAYQGLLLSGGMDGIVKI